MGVVQLLSWLCYAHSCAYICRELYLSFLFLHIHVYIGPKKAPNEAAEFIKQMFLSVNDEPDKRIFPHFTTATDTENIERVFEAVKTTVLEDNLRDYNLIV